jgi:hypothetical protein
LDKLSSLFVSRAMRVLVGDEARPGRSGDLLAGNVIARVLVVVGDATRVLLCASVAFFANSNLYRSAAEAPALDAGSAGAAPLPAAGVVCVDGEATRGSGAGELDAATRPRAGEEGCVVTAARDRTAAGDREPWRDAGAPLVLVGGRRAFSIESVDWAADLGDAFTGDCAVGGGGGFEGVDAGGGLT